MRTPRIAIVVFFLASSFFLVGRAVSSAVSRSSPSIHRSPAQSSKSDKAASVWGLIYYNTPFSLFPPNAAISLTDDNSTSFAARPAAFGPQLAPRGLSGQLWVGSGFTDDALDGEGELGCSDLPGWDGGGTWNSLKSSTLSSAGAREDGPSTSARKPSRPERDGGRLLLDGGNRVSSSKPSKDGAVQRGSGSSTDDGTDNHLNQGSATGSPHADIQSIQEAAEIRGKVVLLMRGGCGFLEKVMWAQRRGAVAVIVGDNQKGGPLIQMFAHGDAVDNVTIPSVFTTRTTAQILSSLTQPGSFIEDALDDDGKPVLKVQQGPKPKTGSGSSGNSRVRRGQISSAPRAAQMTGSASSRKQKKVPFPDADSSSQSRSWLSRLFGSWGEPSRNLDKNSRPPNSGRLDWVLVEDWDVDKDQATQASMGSSRSSKKSPPDDDSFVIGVQDWRDPDLVDRPQSPNRHRYSQSESSQKKTLEHLDSKASSGRSRLNLGTNTRRSSSKEQLAREEAAMQGTSANSGRKGHGLVDSVSGSGSGSGSSTDEQDADDALPPSLPDDEHHGLPHEGLWVTITPTSSASPFFDTLLVLVISPLVTLTVVYALLIVRARIRRRQWRAPKSVVDRLPVRTYHTVAASPTPTPPSGRQPSPSSASPTTPLLRSSNSSSRTPSPSSFSRPRSRTATGVPENDNLGESSSAIGSARQTSRARREKANRGFPTAWRRYMSRQVECVVCLEEYVDGVSRVMRLPCGHEFHVDCITPWLTTRRRTCPICKGDVVRSLAHASSSAAAQLGSYHDDSDDDDYDDDEASHAPMPSGSRVAESDPSDLEQGILRPERQDRPWLNLWPSHFGSQSRQGDGGH
ncbi:PA domain [Geosmithia morbida]|uniref:RING-type E3 ubiquitin transferase n=1 Tax=Geosmithia morbida TaxID=1094350 RepID=A0A9P4Z122_9HYPO|nr:PA domain [Geosmithia morbida]KAF4124664.1 PA domain [Geosmithia morbida]